MDDPTERGDHPLSDGRPSDTPDTSRDQSPYISTKLLSRLFYRTGVTLEIAI